MRKDHAVVRKSATMSWRQVQFEQRSFHKIKNTNKRDGYYKDKVFTDFCIKIKNEEDVQEISCHRIILSSSSQFFSGMLETDQTCQELILNEVDFNAVKIVLEYLYYETITLNAADVFKVLEVSIFFQIDELTEDIVQYLKSGLNAENCLQYRDSLLYLNLQEAAQNVDMFIDKNFKDVTMSTDFKKSNYEFIEKLVDRNDLEIKDEKEVFDAVLMWISYDHSNRKQHVHDLITKVRLPLMESIRLSDAMFDPILENDSLLQQSFKEAIYYKSNGELRPGQNLISEAQLLPRKCNQLHQPVHVPSASSDSEQTLVCISGHTRAHKTLKSIEISNDCGRTWLPGQNIEIARKCFGAAITKGFIYIVGGRGPDGPKLRSCVRYDLSQKRWANVISLPEPRSQMGVTIFKKKIYVTGGYAKGEGRRSVLSLKIDGPYVTGCWSSSTPMIKKRYGHISCTSDEYMYCVSGCGTTSCERYDAKLNKWSKIASTKHQHWSSGGCFDTSGRLYVAGGIHKAQKIAVVERYDPFTNEWSELSSYALNVAKSGITLTSCGNKMLCIGGEDENGEVLDTVDEFDSRNDTWSVVGHLKAARFSHALVVNPTT